MIICKANHYCPHREINSSTETILTEALFRCEFTGYCDYQIPKTPMKERISNKGIGDTQSFAILDSNNNMC